MKILAIDPGARPGYCVAEVVGGQFRVLRTARTLPRTIEGPFDVVCERPQLRADSGARARGKQRINPQAVVTLACTAGRQLGQAEALPGCCGGHWVTVGEWKGALRRGGARLPKVVLLNWLRAQLGLGPEISDDEVDACGIAWGWLAARAKTNALIRRN